MKHLLSYVALYCGLLLMCMSIAHAEVLQGTIGFSPPHKSGWIDLSPMIDFRRGDRLRLKIGGSATKIVVRLLSRDMDPNTPSGIEGDAVDVPENRIVEMVLQQDRKNIVQVSVHGGANPWGLFPLGGGNGPATLLRVERMASAEPET